jgi:phosphoribosylglycinamide formyltransferase-1
LSPDATGDAGRFGMLISGRGSNMLALIRAARDGRIPAMPAVVIANVAGAAGLAAAEAHGVPTAVVDHTRSGSREEHDRKVMEILAEHQVDLVCLAGYMRLLSAEFVAAYPQRILNIHPSLLPAFPGLHAQRQALEFGVKVSGCTVHFVDEKLDHGPIVAQATLALEEDEDEEHLSARILELEHRLYPSAVRSFFLGRLTLQDDRVTVAEPAGG